MKKVIWPNRQQMVNYTIVVLIFLTFMTVLIGLVDLGLAKLMLLVFGSRSSARDRERGLHYRDNPRRRRHHG